MMSFSETFLGGLSSSLLPCTISLFPAVLAIFMGFSADKSLKSLMIQALLFCTGFAIQLSLRGTLKIQTMTQTMLAQAGSSGPIETLMPMLWLATLFSGSLGLWLWQNQNDGKQSFIQTYGLMALAGLVFGLSGTPCGTPTLTRLLGSIVINSNSQLSNPLSVTSFAFSLFCYALGQSVLFMPLALLTAWFRRQLGQAFGPRVVRKIAACLFGVLALGLVTLALELW